MNPIRYLLLLFSAIFINPLFSQISWINPLPQGDLLTSVEFITEDTVFAAGHGGIIMKSTNGGNDWELTDRATGFNILDLFFINEKLGFAAADSGVILKSNDGGNTWEEIVNPALYPLNGIFFIDTIKGFAVGDLGTILRSDDGGQTWDKVISPTGTHLSGLQFITEHTGYIVGGNYNFESTLLKTTDAGNTWEVINSGIENHLYTLFFIDSLTGFVAGGYSKIAYTTDGGFSWFSIPNPNQTQQNKIKSIIFPDPDTGYTVDLSGNIMISTSGGGSWENMISPTSKSLYDIGFNGISKLIAVGQGGQILASETGPEWSKISQGPIENLMAFNFPNSSEGIITGEGILMTSLDGGNNWDYDTISAPDNVKDAHFVNMDVGYVLQGNGSIIRTLDGGETWVQVHPENRAEVFSAIFMKDETTGFMVGGGQSPGGATWSTVYKTTNGINWGTQSVPAGNILFNVYFYNDNLGFMMGAESNLLKTVNGGNTWSSIDISTVASLFDAHFISPSKGFIIGTGQNGSSYVFRTTDGGNSWSTVFELKDPKRRTRFTGISFGDTISGYVTGNYGNIIRTTDGGSTWEKLPRFTSSYLTDVYMKNDKRGFIAGLNGTLLNVETMVGITEPSANNPEIPVNIFPNPARGILNIGIETAFKGTVSYRVLNQVGQVLFEQEALIDGPEITGLNIEDLDRGVYFIEIQTSGGFNLTRKFVKMD